MNDWLNNPWVIRIITLFLAILIFMVVTFDNQDNQADDVGFEFPFSSSQETQVVEDVLVNIEIDRDRYVVSGVPKSVSVTLEGTVSIVQSTATQQNFDVFIDLEDFGPGTYTVPLQYDGISDRLDVSVDPSEIEVTIEERSDVEFEVKADYINEDKLEAGYELTEASIDPSTVVITSSKGVTDRIAVVKAVVDVEGIGESLEIEDVPVRVYDSEGNELNVRVEPSTVDVTVNVDNPNENIPVEVDTIGQLPDNIRMVSISAETEEVQVFAAQSELDDISEIMTEAIDLSEITEDTTVEVGLNSPENVRLIEPSTVTVNIDVEQTIEETIESVAITTENLDNSYTASFVTPFDGEVDVSVKGFESDIEDIGLEDFQLTIDASGLEPGEHQVPISVTSPSDLNAVPSVEIATIRIE
ncbi:CdaA regulatory protein CdaR [Paraliobacillus quinghaiensis]|uniref:CdaA regulatory protein CdaR n=1 Tax=Paraliobacillus quinghaiensis TaxID=470815 RepID=A0A917TVD3_9BACI|nr:CdaR family protein [Paraliobacillus quinghaiensis]GGM39235.1 CdaA regulatory protein CdaR [Paraliobacillus quinghaiensis]